MERAADRRRYLSVSTRRRQKQRGCFRKNVRSLPSLSPPSSSLFLFGVRAPGSIKGAAGGFIYRGAAAAGRRSAERVVDGADYVKMLALLFFSPLFFFPSSRALAQDERERRQRQMKKVERGGGGGTSSDQPLPHHTAPPDSAAYHRPGASGPVHSRP